MLVVVEREQLPVSKARAGVAEAWDTLLQRYQLPLYVYVFEMVHDEQASRDIVQETFTSAVRHLASLRDDAKFGSWLFGIAHQKCIQLWRKQNREHALLEEVAGAPPNFDEGPLEVLLRQEQEAEFMELLNQLPLPQRSVLLLHFMEDFSLAEIAGVTGVSVGTVKSRLHYAKKALGKIIETGTK